MDDLDMKLVMCLTAQLSCAIIDATSYVYVRNQVTTRIINSPAFRDNLHTQLRDQLAARVRQRYCY